MLSCSEQYHFECLCSLTGPWDQCNFKYFYLKYFPIMYIKRCQNFSIKKMAEGGRKKDVEGNCRRPEHSNSTNAMKVWRNYSNFINFNNFCQGMEDTVWRVGCYNINPTTPNGQKFFILHMLVLPLIPITALVIQVWATNQNHLK